MALPKPPSFQEFKFPLFPIIVLSIAFVLLIFSISPYYQRQEPIFPSRPMPYITPTIRLITPLPTSFETNLTCPASDWVDCMPGPDKPQNPQCQPEFLEWATANCPNFQGAAL